MSDPRKSDRTRAAILAAARRRFAADGYERATIRAIAADAYIDPSMVIRYFGSKDRLFDAAVAGAGALLPAPAAIPPDRRGDTLVRWFADCWREPYRDDRLVALFKSALQSRTAAQRLRALIEGYLAALLPEGEAGTRDVRIAVAATQLYGAALYSWLGAPDPARPSKGAKLAAAAPPGVPPDGEEFLVRLGAVVQGLFAAEPVPAGA
ncbi:MAG TPA: TetR family transcriptional regulator [Actinocrinis sp.]|nr:TetR family transcriptional regulator [Actinocrinis sp.]